MTLFRMSFFFVISILTGWAGGCSQAIDQQVADFQKEVQFPQNLKGYISILDKMNQTFSDQNISIKQYCQDKGYALWPLQETWQQVLISEIFYPKQEIESVYEGCGGNYQSGDWVLVTRSVIERLAISASNGNPVAALYLGDAFTQTRYTHQDRCPIAHQLYEKAFETLKKTASQSDHPHRDKACYFLACAYYNSGYMDYNINSGNDSYNNPDIAFKYLEKLSSPNARLLKMKIEFEYEKHTTPSLENFLTLGYLEEYPMAFIKGLALFSRKINSNDKVQVLEKAIQTIRHPALYLELFSFHKENFKYSQDVSLKEKMLSLLEQAGDMGSPIAYRKMVELLVPYKIVGSYFEFEKAASSEDLKKCEVYLQKAATLGLPEAFYNLALLAQEYHRRQGIENPLLEDVVERVETSVKELCKKAAQRGFWSIHGVLETILNPDDEFFADYPNLQEEKVKLYQIVVGTK